MDINLGPFRKWILQYEKHDSSEALGTIKYDT